MAKESRLYIRIDEDLKEKLKQKADKENRTLSNYIENILKKEIYIQYKNSDTDK